MMAHGVRIQGTIGLITPNEGNFNAHLRRTPKGEDKYIKLPHGRASVGGDQVRLTLRIGLDEAGIIPSEAIEDESRRASNFVDDALDDFRDTFGW